VSKKKPKTIRVRQIRSGIGYARDQRATLDGLSLGRPGWTSEVEDTPAVRGMIRKVHHLVRVEGEE
jgi:large subunit ribosomal protein L30